MAKLEGARDQCRHCKASLVFWKPDEKVERYEQMVYRSEKARWWHLNPDPSAFNAANNVFLDAEYGMLGAWCPQSQEEGTMQGQPGEPVGYCVVLKGEWPNQLCNNPVTDPDLFMCGVHAKKERESQRVIEARRANREGDEAMRVGMDEVIRRIKDNWGLTVTTSGYRLREGLVEVNHEQLETLLESFAEEHKELAKKKGRTKRAQDKSESVI